MNSESEARRLMIQAIDKERAWIHLGMTYASSIAHDEYVKRNKKTGKMDKRDNRVRLAYALNHAIGDVIDFANIAEWMSRVKERKHE